MGTSVDKTIVAASHEYAMGEHAAPSLILVTPVFADIRLVDQSRSINGADEAPGAEWKVVPPSGGSIVVESLNNHPNGRYRIERLPLSATAANAIGELDQAAALDRNDSEARKRAVATYETWLGKPGPRSADTALVEAFALTRLADLYRREADYESARDTLQRVVDRHEALLPWAMIQIGSMHFHDYAYDDALAGFCSALKALQVDACKDDAVLDPAGEWLGQSMTTRLWIADALLRIGTVSLERGNLDVAARKYAMATLAAPPEALELRATVASSMGGISYFKGDADAALASLDTSRAAYQRAGNEHEAGYVLMNIARVHLLSANHDAAIESLLAALEVFERHGDLPEEAYVREMIGTTYLESGVRVQAEQFLTRSIAMRRNNPVAVAPAELSLANLYRDAGRLDEAIEIHRRVLETYRSVERQSRVVAALTELAIDHIHNREFTSARPIVAEAMALSAETDDTWLAGRLLQARAAIEVSEHAYDVASATLDAALVLQQKIGDTVGSIQTFTEQARIEELRGCPTCALTTLANAQELLEQSRLDVSNPTLRASFTGEHMDLYARQISLLMQSDRVEEALEVAINSQTRTLMEEVLYRTATTAMDPLRQQASRLKTQLAAKSMAKVEAGRRWVDFDAAQNNKEIADITFRLDVLETRMLSGRMGASPNITIKELRAHLAPDDLLTVHFSGEREGWVWYVSATEVRSSTLGSRAALTGLVTDTIDTMRAGRPTPDAASLSKLLVPDSSATPARVFVVPSDVTGLVPFNALAPARDLIVTVVPTASMLESRQSRPRQRAALLVSDPVFGPDDGRLDSPTSIPVARFQRLPFSVRETTALGETLASAGFELRHLTGFDATKASVLGARINRFGVVHFATHGIADLSRPDLSGLVLTTTGQDGAEYDNSMLTLSEIYDLGLDADLVVLSACDTALGGEIQGEGPISLARGFIIGGARQVVASLWRVPDRSTAELMRHFYEAWVAGESAPSALRIAQRTLAETPRFRKPVHWGAFVIVGV